MRRSARRTSTRSTSGTCPRGSSSIRSMSPRSWRITRGWRTCTCRPFGWREGARAAPSRCCRRASRSPPACTTSWSWAAEPLGGFACAPVSGGAAALVLGEMQKARKSSDTPIRIAGSGQASDFLALHDRRDLTTLDATVIAGKRAFHEARLQPKDVQVAEVHDNFTISEILAIEDLRFIEKGKDGPATAEGLTALNGKISVNTSGGLKARGQPVGATGVAQAVEIVRQLRGQGGKRQVVGARRGLTHTLGGTGATAVVHIFERGD